MPDSSPTQTTEIVIKTVELLMDIPEKEQSKELKDALDLLSLYLFQHKKQLESYTNSKERQITDLKRLQTIQYVMAPRVQSVSGLVVSTNDDSDDDLLQDGKSKSAEPQEVPELEKLSLDQSASSTTLCPFGDTSELDELQTISTLNRIQAKAAMKRSLTSQRRRKGIEERTSKVIFGAHDVDNSNGISAKEFKTLVYSMGVYLSDQDASLAVASLDKNHTGEISYDEFLVWWFSADRFARLNLTEQQTEVVQRASEYFMYFDEYERGYLDSPEFERMYVDMRKHQLFSGDRTCEQAKLLIKGGNRDPNVTFTDYIGWLLRTGCVAPLIMDSEQ